MAWFYTALGDLTPQLPQPRGTNTSIQQSNRSTSGSPEVSLDSGHDKSDSVTELKGLI